MKTIITLITLVVILPELYSQEQINLDLSENANGVITQNVTSNTKLHLTIENKMPGKAYEITTEVKYDLPKVLSIKQDDEDSLGVMMESATCVEFIKLVDAVKMASSEDELPNATEALKSSLETLREALEQSDRTTEGCTSEHVIKAEQVLKKTRMTLIPQKLKKGQSLEVTVKRKKDGEDGFVVWKYIFNTGKRGQWFTTYGFTYIPKLFNEGESFFSKQTDTVFAVTPLNQRSKLTFVPSIFFTWFPYKDIGKNWSPSFTGGIGYDLEAPTAFLGANFLYNQNIGISLGLAAHQQDFLNGRYDEGDILKENLEANQLNEKLYTLNPYVSVSFRFGAVPFKGNDSPESNED